MSARNGWYDVAQICLNGHVITKILKIAPEFGKKFCDKCGVATISACPACAADIRGTYHIPGGISVGGPRPPAPAFCHNCGLPYPWTEKGLEAARELVSELEPISSAAG